MMNLLLDQCSDQISQQLFKELFDSVTAFLFTIFVLKQKNMLTSILWHSFDNVRNEISDKVCSSVHFKVRNLVSATVCHESLAAIFFS